MSLQLHKIFQEMIYVLDWMDEIKVHYLTRDTLSDVTSCPSNHAR